MKNALVQRSFVPSLVAFAFVLVNSPNAFAAAPSNDNCSGAEVISPNGPFPYLTSIRDLTSATTNGDTEPLCASLSDLSRSLWYRFTPAASGPYIISSCPDAPTATTVDDTVMAIFTSANGCAGPMVQIADGCADDTCGASGLNAA